MILALYNPEWPAEFAAIRAVYMSSHGKLVLRVEHVGSTAVPILRAKPILDIDIVMPGYEVFPDTVAHLTRGACGRHGFAAPVRSCFAPLSSPSRADTTAMVAKSSEGSIGLAT